MNKFESSVHTPEALREELSVLSERYPDALLAGSLGRAAIYHDVAGTAEVEYLVRDQMPIQTYRGEPADIDLINGYPSIEEDGFGPFGVDVGTLNSSQVSIVFEDGQWILRSDNRGYEEILDSRVFEPMQSQTVYGAPCTTVPAQTHAALMGINGTIRPQDEQATRLLKDVLISGKTRTLPDVLYEPFEELRELNYKSAMARTRRTYRTIVPFAVRKAAAPATQRVKNQLLR
jgi:hypothetical protein